MKVVMIVVLLSVLTWEAGYSQTGEQRLKVIEERVSRIEQKLERIFELLSLPDQQQELRAIREETAAVAEEARAARAESIESPQREASPAVTAVVSPGAADASEEVVNVPYSGYMELHLNHDNLNPTTLDFHRFVLLFGHGFGERIRFWSELELEHAFVEGGEASGELELEQAFLDFLIHSKFNFRTGMLLAPVGLINERHEPPSFNGVERPFVDTVIVPTTWFASGAGILGDLGKGFSYKTYLMSSLDATQFSAEEGFREGRQKGFFENARNLAVVGRLDYRGVPGLNLGTSFWTGETGFNFRDLNGRALIFETDGRYRLGRLEGRGQIVITRLKDAAEINRALQRQKGVNPNIAEKMLGFYLEGGVSLVPAHFAQDIVAFYRYENFDTQYRMPEGFLPLKQFDRSAHVLGLTYFPYPDIAFKIDYNFMRNASAVIKPPDRWNLGVGWWF
ncbi:MAG: hypothetical protein ACRD1R_04900 [Acidobacteriota bacterium]